MDLLSTAEPDTVRAVLDPEHIHLREHVVRGRHVLPGVVSLDLALRGAAERHADVAGIADVTWLRPVFDDELVLTFRGADYTATNRGVPCGGGTFLLGTPDRAPAVPLAVRDRICEHSRSHFTRREVYDEFANMGIDYGPYFRRIGYVQRHEQLSLAWLSNNDGIQLDLVNLLDCSFQAGMAISIGEHRDSLMPLALGQMVFHAPVRAVGSVYVLTVKHSAFRTSFTVYDEDYQPLISVFDLGVKPATLPV